MFDWLFEYYNMSNYDTRPGAGITLSKDKALGLTVGDERPLYTNYLEEDADDLEDVIIDDESAEAVGIKLNNPVYKIDPKRSTVSHTGGNMRQSPGLNEKSDHTTTAVKGISPRMTYRGAKTKGPAFGVQTTATYIRNRPGRKSGTQYGTSRAPIDYDMDFPLKFGDDPIDKMFRSFLKHQKQIKKINKKYKDMEKPESLGYLSKNKNMYKGSKKRRYPDDN